MLNEHERPSRLDELHDDARDAARDHEVTHDVEHDEASVATETTETEKPFPVLEEPTWLDAEDDEDLEEPRDSAFRGIWIGILAAAVTFAMVFAIPHWLGWYDIGPSVPSAKRELNPDSVIASVTAKSSAEAPAAEPAAAPAEAPPAPAKPAAPPVAAHPPAAVEPKAPAPPKEARPAPREVKPAPAAPREVKAAATRERKPAKGKTFSVQIAAFKNAREAGKAAERAKRAGYSADVLRVDTSVPWVVRIGGYSTREQAESVRDALAKKGFRGGFIL
jgi:cell division septation protein DedD